MLHSRTFWFFFFFNDTATTEIYTSFPTRRSSDLSRDSARHKSISQAVVQYIVQDMRPLDSVNDPGFINLIPVLEPRYDLENIPWLCSVLHGMSSPRSSASENDEELGSWSLRAGTNCTYLTL